MQKEDRDEAAVQYYTFSGQDAAVLIPTINNADELEIVLERLSKQTYPH